MSDTPRQTRRDQTLDDYLTDEQQAELAKGIQMIKNLTGFGEVKVIIQNGHPRFLSVEFSQEIKDKKEQLHE